MGYDILFLRKERVLLTAEIVICNKHGIVLAADSAVTLGGGTNSKIYNTARKVFSVDGHDIGLMTYGNANLNSIPIDLIFKTFSEKVRSVDCGDDFEDYISLFLEHVDSMGELKSDLSENKFIYSVVNEIKELVTSHLNKKIDDVLSEQGSAPPEVVIELLDNTLDNILHILENSVTEELFEGIESYVKDHYQELMKDVFENEFVDYLYETIDWGKISNILILLLNSKIGVDTSGIVICGYGKNDIFPNHFKIEISGVINGVLRVISEEKYKIDQNRNKAAIFPLAQTDVVNTLIQGIDPELFTFLRDHLDFDSENEKKEENFKLIREYVQEHYTDPFINIIGSLPLEEVANVAETMINLTSFKRKFSSAQETVGGPIDVLAISRLDGPIWIKRKHYFDIDKNLSYKLKKGGN